MIAANIAGEKKAQRLCCALESYLSEGGKPNDQATVNRPGFELTPRSWTVMMSPFGRYLSAGIALG